MESDCDSSNTDDLLVSGIQTLESISPLPSPVSETPDTCFDKSNPNTIQRIVSHEPVRFLQFTTSTREALSNANRSYERWLDNPGKTHKQADRTERYREESAKNDTDGDNSDGASTPTRLEEHVRFAENLLTSPTSTCASLSPVLQISNQPIRQPASVLRDDRSSSHQADSGGRRKLDFEDNDENGNQKTVDDIQALQVMQLRSKIRSELEILNSGSITRHKEIPTTPNTKDGPLLVRVGPMSSTPHRPSYRPPLRELSPSRLFVDQLGKTDHHPQQVQTPTHIRELQSVRFGLKRLLAGDLDNLPQDAHANLDDPPTQRRIDEAAQKIEFTVHAENQLLRETLERERKLRKQIEDDKHELQANLLESKDRLNQLNTHVKHKESVIKRLDQNLEEVLQGWQKHEAEARAAAESLTYRCRRLERELEDLQRHSASLEMDMLNAIDDMKREKQRADDLTSELNDQRNQQVEEVDNLRRMVESESERASRLELERQQACEGKDHLEGQIKILQESLYQERELSKGREAELLSKIADLTKSQANAHDQEQVRSQQQTQKIDELSRQVEGLQQEVQSQRHLVTTKQKETEKVRAQLELILAKQEQAMRQLEYKMKIDFEVKISQVKEDSLRRLAENEHFLLQSHQRQISELSGENSRLLGEMREKFSNELSRVKTQFEQQLQTCDKEVGAARDEVGLMARLRDQALAERDELSARLQAVLTLLGASNIQTSPMPANYLNSLRTSLEEGRADKRVEQHRFTSGVSSEAFQHIDRAQNGKYTSGSINSPREMEQNFSSNNAPLKSDIHGNQGRLSDVYGGVSHRLTVAERHDGVTDNYKLSTTSGSHYGENTGPDSPHTGPESSGLTGQESSAFTDQESSPLTGLEISAYSVPDTSVHLRTNMSSQLGPEMSHSNDSKIEDKEDERMSTATYDIEGDSTQGHKRQIELQDYIKKLLNRSVGDPLHESRSRGGDNSHHPVISDLQTNDDNSYQKQAFLRERLRHTPPVKGSSKKVDPQEIAQLIDRYGSNGVRSPHTIEYLESLKRVHRGRSVDRNDAGVVAIKKDLTQSFDLTSAQHHRTTSESRLKMSSPEKNLLSKHGREQKAKRHVKAPPVWR